MICNRGRNERTKNGIDKRWARVSFNERRFHQSINETFEIPFGCREVVQLATVSRVYHGQIDDLFASTVAVRFFIWLLTRALHTANSTTELKKKKQEFSAQTFDHFDWDRYIGEARKQSIKYVISWARKKRNTPSLRARTLAHTRHPSLSWPKERSISAFRSIRAARSTRSDFIAFLFLAATLTDN